MPKPNAGESRDDYMSRCIEQVLDDGGAADQDQAVAMCSSMWEDAGKKSAQPYVRRAYGLLEVKRFDDEQRVIEGWASTPTPDRMNDVVNPLSARYNLPLPLLFMHSASLPVGEVFEARASKDGIAVKARIFKATQSRTLKERLDEAWESVKISLIRGFSIGFTPIDPPEIIEKTGGYWYRGAWEWLELSLVALPAQSEATITAVKSLYREQQAANGGGVRVVKLDDVTVAKARRSVRPGVVFLK